MEPVDLRRRLAFNVKLLRLEAGLSQEELATKCGVHRTYFGAVERGERNVTLQVVPRIALALNVDPADLLSDMAS